MQNQLNSLIGMHAALAKHLQMHFRTRLQYSATLGMATTATSSQSDCQAICRADLAGCLMQDLDLAHSNIACMTGFLWDEGKLQLVEEQVLRLTCAT